MLIDSHTHVFPQEVCRDRASFLERDANFRELYGNPKARLATADDVLYEMERSGVDVSVIVAFPWADAGLCRQTNDYVLEAAARSGGRLVPFCMPPFGDGDASREIERCAAAGAKGLGELRPHRQGFSLLQSREASLLGEAAASLDLTLLFHVSEPVGHHYNGREGLPLGEFYGFLEHHPGVKVIGAHWGGGLPLLALRRGVRETIATVYFDTAATGYLYDPRVFRQVIQFTGIEKILFATDYPLVGQKRCIDELAAAKLSEDERRLVLGENACRLLGLSDG